MNLVAERNHSTVSRSLLSLLAVLVFVLPQLELTTSGKMPFMLPGQWGQAPKATQHPWWSASLVYGGH